MILGYAAQDLSQRSIHARDSGPHGPRLCPGPAGMGNREVRSIVAGIHRQGPAGAGGISSGPKRLEVVEAVVRFSQKIPGGKAVLKMAGQEYGRSFTGGNDFGEQRVEFEVPQWKGAVEGRLEVAGQAFNHIGTSSTPIPSSNTQPLPIFSAISTSGTARASRPTEDDLRDLATNGKSVKLSFKPYEVLTVRVAQ